MTKGLRVILDYRSQETEMKIVTAILCQSIKLEILQAQKDGCPKKTIVSLDSRLKRLKQLRGPTIGPSRVKDNTNGKQAGNYGVKKKALKEKRESWRSSRREMDSL